MTTYQLVPYLVSVSLRNKPDETRPLDDLFGGGEQLANELGGLLRAHNGLLCQQKGKAKRPLTLRVEHVGVGDRQLSATMSSGRSGVESSIRTPTGREVKRGFDDTELVPLRHVLTYAPAAHRAVLLAERVGGAGAITALSALLKDTWRTRHAQVTLNIAPAVGEEAWAASLSHRPVKGFRLTKPATQNGNFAIDRTAVEYSLDVRPVRKGQRWSLERRIKKAQESGTPLSNLILQEMTPVLAPGATNAEDAASALLEDGWQVAVTLDLPGGTSRTVFVETNAAVSMSFPVIDGEAEPAARPKTDQVMEGVRRIISDGLLETWGLQKYHAEHCAWQTDPCDDGIAGWKVQWDVIGQPSAGGK